MLYIPAHTYAPDARRIINDNLAEIEARLRSVEVVSYIRYGDGIPSNSSFNENDFYIDRSTYKLYHKEDGVWQFKTDMKGQAGIKNRGTWDNTATYSLDDAVSYRGSMWRSKTSQINVEPTTDNSLYWERVVKGFNPAGNWVSGASYRVDDIVIRNGSSYRVLTNHTSSTAPESDNVNYVLHVSKGDTGAQGRGFTHRGKWDSATAYVVDDIVTTDEGNTFRALVASTNVSPPTTFTSNATWQAYVSGGINYRGSWSSTTTYNNRELVRYRNSTYIYINTTPSSGNLPTNTTYWALWTPGNIATGVWAANTLYQVGDVVSVGSSSFIVTATHTSGTVAPTPSTPGANYSLIARGVNPRGAWAASTAYDVDDLVTSGGSVFRVIAAHTSGAVAPTVATPGANYLVHVQAGAVGQGVPAAGAAGYVLKKNTATDYDTSWVKKLPTTLVDYISTTDLYSGAQTVAASTWYNVGPVQNFTVGSASSIIEFIVGGNVLVGNVATAINMGSRLLIDGATVLVIGGGWTEASTYINVLAGANNKFLSLSAGAHTAQFQVIGSQANFSIMIRSTLTTVQEVLYIQIREHFG